MKSQFGSALLATATQFIVPFILLFALYVVFHGHYSPGGGFQGGAMIAGALILLRLTQGDGAVLALSKSSAELLALAGVALFAGVGLLCLLSGGRFLDYAALPMSMEAPYLRYYGILAVELGVTMGVAGVLVLISQTLSGAQESEED